MTRRSYSGNAPATTLSAGINNSALSLSVASATGYPAGGGAGPFFIVIDRGLATEEKLLIDSVSGTTFTVNASGRGADGTTASSHTSGAVVEHVISKTDIDEANAHVNDTTTNTHPQYVLDSDLVAAAYLNAAAHDVEARHTFGAAYGTPATPSTTSQTTAAVGTGDNPAREDHVHLQAAETPRGVLGRTAHSSDYTLTTSYTDVVSVTVTTVASRRYRISGHVHGTLLAAGYQISIRLVEGGTTFSKDQMSTDTFTSAEEGLHVETVIVPGAGSHTYKIQGVTSPSTGGSGAITDSTTGAGYIMVEDIGV